MSVSQRLTRILIPRKSWLAAVAVFDVLVVAWVLSGAQNSGGSGVRLVDDPESLRADAPSTVTTVAGSGSAPMLIPGLGRPSEQQQQENRSVVPSRPAGATSRTGGVGSAPATPSGDTAAEKPVASPPETSAPTPGRAPEEPEFHLPDPPLDGDFCDLYAWWTSVRIPAESQYIRRWAGVATEVLPVVLEVAPEQIAPEVQTLHDAIRGAVDLLASHGYDPSAVDLEEAFGTVDLRLAAGRIDAWVKDNC